MCKYSAFKEAFRKQVQLYCMMFNLLFKILGHPLILSHLYFLSLF